MLFTHRSRFRCTPEALFRFHERADALHLLTPPWAMMKVDSPAKSLQVGAEAHLRVPVLPPIRVAWHARHTVYEPPERFVDEQVKGPFRRWRHEHIIRRAGDGAELEDRIDFEPPLGWAGRLAGRALILPMLRAMFAYRHAVTRRHVEA